LSLRPAIFFWGGDQDLKVSILVLVAGQDAVVEIGLQQEFLVTGRSWCCGGAGQQQEWDEYD